MKRYSLNGQWQLRAEEDNEFGISRDYFPAEVPGTVMGTCYEQGLIPDPYYRENELAVLPLFNHDFTYEKRFTVTEEMLSHDEVFLLFHGIDTLAEVYLNDTFLGRTENMHREYRFLVSAYLSAGENFLRVELHSPVKYVKRENEKVFAGGVLEGMEGYPHLRKSHCMFGWDWGPRLPDMGIFRPVELVAVDTAELEQVYVIQEHGTQKTGSSMPEAGGTAAGGSRTGESIPAQTAESTQAAYVCLKLHTAVRLTAQAEGQRNDKAAKTVITAEAVSPEGERYEMDADGRIWITEPELWWPNGYGAQPLYTVRVELKDEQGQVLDVWEKKIGLRTMTVDTEADEWGNKFAHRVNGLDIFAMGADYIPEDCFLSRCSRERTRKLLTDCAAANYNSIRVWGGGYYPEDAFYELCDELGLVVWQDFMFACSSYELDAAFDENIREEIRQNIRRIRHHACLGLWCGNNEMETQTLDGCWKPSPKQKSDYTKIFEYIIPNLVKEEDPQTFYWPSSPSSGGSFDNPWDENRGDAHYWDVWHGSKPFTAYRSYHFRYLSEFGFQSFPCLKTVESFTEQKDRNIFSRVMEMHQRNRAANGKILDYLSQTFLYPKDFDSLLYASQLLQAEAIRYGVEHFRRFRGRCMGTVVWQLNDVWPVASWASIDYYGRWKALHYAERRMFAPLLVSCEETGELTERPYCIQERTAPMEKAIRLHVANETRQEQPGKVFWELRDAEARILEKGSETVCVPALDGIWLDRVVLKQADELANYVSYRFVQNGETVSEGTVLFTAPKHFRFTDPRLSLTVCGRELTVSAAGYARSVELIPQDGEARFSDNFFDLNGDSKTVTMLEGDATRFTVRSVYDIAE